MQNRSQPAEFLDDEGRSQSGRFGGHEGTDDVEGHTMRPEKPDPDDVEAHAWRHIEQPDTDEEDTEGHPLRH